MLHLPPEEQIVELTILPTQVAGPLADGKEIVLDIRAKTRSGRQFHVEVQVRAFVSYPERMIFYWAGMYHGQAQRGQGYTTLQPVLSVHVLGFYLLPQEEKYQHWHHVFDVVDRETGYRLSPHLELHTIEMPKFLKKLDELSTDAEKWVYFLLHGHEMSDEDVRTLALPEIARAEEKLAVISQDWILREQYEQRLKAERDEIAWKADHLTMWERERQKLEAEQQEQTERAEQAEQTARQAEQTARQAILDISELLGIAVTAERRALLEKLDLAGLEQLRQHLKQQRAWPA